MVPGLCHLVPLMGPGVPAAPRWLCLEVSVKTQWTSGLGLKELWGSMWGRGSVG